MTTIGTFVSHSSFWNQGHCSGAQFVFQQKSSEQSSGAYTVDPLGDRSGDDGCASAGVASLPPWLFGCASAASGRGATILGEAPRQQRSRASADVVQTGGGVGGGSAIIAVGGRAQRTSPKPATSPTAHEAPATVTGRMARSDPMWLGPLFFCGGGLQRCSHTSAFNFRSTHARIYGSATRSTSDN